jgi:Na+/H+-translocating membrane pyrophosphatase
MPHEASTTHRILVNIVFQVALISALTAAVLVATVAWSMRQRRGLIVPHEARRVLVAIERATWGAIRRRALGLPWAAGGVLCLMMLSQYVLPSSIPSHPTAFALLGATAAMALGILASFSIALLCGRHSRQHAFLGVTSASLSVNRCLAVSVSGAAALTVTAEALGMLAAAAVHGLLWLLARGAIDPAASHPDVGLIAARISPYFGIGATLAALALEQTGVACVGAAKLAGTSTFEVRTGLSARDPRNPSVLVEAIARQLGGIVPRVLDAFIGGGLLAAISLQLASLAPHLGWPVGSTAIAMIPLLVRGFGLLASLFGLLTLRATEHEDLHNAFVRGQLVAHIVLASALAGIVVWLVGSISIAVAGAAIVGLLLASTLGHLRAFLLTRARPPRRAADDVGGHGPIAAVEAISSSLKAAIWPIVVYPIAFGLFALWFERAAVSGLQRDVAILIGFTVPSSLTAWNLVVALSRDLGAIGNLSASVGRISLTDDTAHRLRRMADALERFGSSTDSILSDSGALLCGLTAILCVMSHVRAPTGIPSIVALLGISIWVILPGLLATIDSFGTGARTARTQLNEIDRQLRGMRRDGPRIQVPEDFVPSYRSCIELLARDSAHGALAFAVAAIALPALSSRLGAAPENTTGSAALSLAFYTAIAATAGLSTMQVGHAAFAASSLANRGNTPARSSAFPPAVADSEPLRLVEFLGHSLGVSMPLLTKAVALATLAFSALLI